MSNGNGLQTREDVRVLAPHHSSALNCSPASCKSRNMTILPGYSLVVIGFCLCVWCVFRALEVSGKLDDTWPSVVQVSDGDNQTPLGRAALRKPSLFAFAPRFLNGLLHGGRWTVGAVIGLAAMVWGIMLVDKARGSAQLGKLPYPPNYTPQDAMNLFEEFFGQDAAIKKSIPERKRYPIEKNTSPRQHPPTHGNGK